LESTLSYPLGVAAEPFPPGFFDRTDESDDGDFYAVPRFVTHIDDEAIAAVGDLYDELGLRGEVLDLMGSWISHFHSSPARLTVLGMNAAELAGNPMASETALQDLNRDPVLPFRDGSFDAVVCCVSIDYLARPIEVFREVRRVLRPGGLFVCTFSNRLFPTKAVRGWLYAGEEERGGIVSRSFDVAGGWAEVRVERRTPVDHRGDPLVAVWAARTP
jgi:SAM-dependent methyltransferase